MIVMEHMELGSLKSNLMVKKCNPIDKYYNLYFIAQSLSTLHNHNLVHCDLHSGNILLSNHLIAYISDFGLSKPVHELPKSKDIYGVLPCIAPEVLRGKPYTKAADIYSFGIIMWEMTSGIPAFNGVFHDINLSLDICKGRRPDIDGIRNVFDDAEKQKQYENMETKYIELMKKCWDSDPCKRPTADEIYGNFCRWYGTIPIASISMPSKLLKLI
jgi:serine/threonine protein kinase